MEIARRILKVAQRRAGNAKLLIGVLFLANREIGAPVQHPTPRPGWAAGGTSEINF